MRRLLCMLLTALLLVSAMPVTVNAADIDTEATADIITYYVSDSQEMQNAANAINVAGAGEYVIELSNDITGNGISFTKSGAIITIKGNGHTFYCPNGLNVQAWNGATLNLGDGESSLTLKGSSDNDNPGIVYVTNNSICNMYDNVTLRDHTGNNYFGGGVTVEGGTFHMYGGTIQNCGIEGGSVCYGGGVAVINGGTFIMDGGTISDCFVKSNYEDYYDPNRCITAAGAGVFVTGGSTFTMNSGTICKNKAENTEGMAYGGGVAVVSNDSYSDTSEWKKFGIGSPQSTVTVNGGTISENQAQCGAGIFASGYFYAFMQAISWNPAGIGVTENPGLYINGGNISSNAADDSGGGVFVAMLRSAIKCQIHNAEIKSNTANNGAGIENFGYWTQMDISGCTISDNTATSTGGGVMAVSNSSNGYTSIKDTAITNNKSGDRGAGVYYDKNSVIRISGVNEIQNNTYNGKQNNLNILSKSKPVYVNGNLTGSQIGLSDPKLWDDGKEDTDDTAVSEDYLTSGYKTYNSANPDTVFTSDHESWYADFSDVNDNEVRLVQSLTVDFHINNDAIASESYDDNDLFTQYVNNLVHTVKVGDTIQEFYLIPTHDTSYIFKGWYYDRANDNDTHPVKFGTDKYTAGKDIYAHWIKIEDVEKDENDTNVLPDEDENKYGGFDLSGVQVRKGILDSNFGYENKPGGLRFLTSLSMDVVDQINAIKPNNIEYGYVASTNGQWINYHEKNGRKLLYNSSSANGIDTTDSSIPESFFGFAKNINCTSKRASSTGVVKEDHRNFDKYLLYTLVITYENADENGYDKNVLARPYIKYTDANGLERVSYSEYRGGSNTLGGCYTSYNANKVQ